jgi:hypothetical protein
MRGGDIISLVSNNIHAMGEAQGVVMRVCDTREATLVGKSFSTNLAKHWIPNFNGHSSVQGTWDELGHLVD